MGLTPVADDQLATVVTTLVMTERPRPRPFPASPLRLQRWRSPAPAAYRTLFRRVGAPWLWYSRLALDDAQLGARLVSPTLQLYAARDAAGIEVGMVELDFAAQPEAELAYFGLVPELTGQGHGRWLMAHALPLLWRPGVERVRVNTCTLDHPSALGFYRAQGFTPVRRTVETFPDPRTLGLLPAGAAPQIPFLASAR
ncbi:GNAT family N-acetyltransferase [Sphingomonas sp.]|uniref:GNAT family N-acetyltransferase n=1 Tax=Sphingomonas sp. TaxID=28214 RepID=UPI003CC65920